MRGDARSMVRVYRGVRSSVAGGEVVEFYCGLDYIRKEIAVTGLVEGKPPGCKRIRAMRRAR